MDTYRRENNMFFFFPKSIKMADIMGFFFFFFRIISHLDFFFDCKISYWRNHYIKPTLAIIMHFPFRMIIWILPVAHFWPIRLNRQEIFSSLGKERVEWIKILFSSSFLHSMVNIHEGMSFVHTVINLEIWGDGQDLGWQKAEKQFLGFQYNIELLPL